MSFVNSIVNRFFAGRLKEIEYFKKNPFAVQEACLFDLINKAKNTEWGKRYKFDTLYNVYDFQKSLPLQKYEDIRPYVDRIRNGEQNILWHSPITWFAKSSGTTEDKSKFIPVSKEALKTCHFQGGKDVLAIYAQQHPNTKVFTSKTLTLGGSHEINKAENNSRYGDLSAILIENIPKWADFIRTPPAKIALLGNFDEKLEQIVKHSINKNVVSFAGVPSWNMVLMKHILNHTGKNNINEVWRNMELFIHGGVCFEPYREQYRQLFPSPDMHYFETYNASEGFFALQDDSQRDDMLLMLDYAVFYEFIPLEQFGKETPDVLTIEQVETNRNYAMVITTNAGLWRYIIGDTVVFTSTFPHKIKISGRTKQFINAFGEELSVDNAERALIIACKATNSIITEYTAGPVYMTGDQNGTHEWLIEFEKEPDDIHRFTSELDKALCSLNSDYEAKRCNDITLSLPRIHSLPKGAFYKWMKKRGKMGGQNKVPRLSNDRKYVDDILAG